MSYNQNAFSFFKRFAELEFLMVEKGVAVIRANDFLDQPDWERLHDYIGEAGAFILEFSSIVTQEPPQSLKYYADQKAFFWSLNEANRFSEADFAAKDPAFKFNEITLALRRVRNNLFHGSKMKDPSAWTNARLDQCIPIVESLIGLVSALDQRTPRRRA